MLSAACAGDDTIPTHGCDSATAHDATADARPTIHFGGELGYNYEPRCIRVRAGATLVFAGPFDVHPLQPGAYSFEEGRLTADPDSPMAPISSGNEVAFPLREAGVHPFFCDAHVSDGMNGAVFVE